jgi:hypothetical protein
VKTTTQQLTRLFRAAAAAPQPELEQPSFGLESRIIAQWRLGRVPADWLEWPTLLFRRAAACAFLLALLAFAWTYSELSEPPPSHAAVAEYEMQLSFLP